MAYCDANTKTTAVNAEQKTKIYKIILRGNSTNKRTCLKSKVSQN